MAYNNRNKYRSESELTRISFGLLTCIGVTLLLCGGISWGVVEGIFPQTGLSYYAMVTVVLSTMLGGIIASRGAKDRWIILTIITDGAYYAFLMITGAVLGGLSLAAVGASGALVLCGMGIACLIVNAGKARGGHRISRYRHG